MTYKEILLKTSQALKAARIPNYQKAALFLVAHSLKISKENLFANPDQKLNKSQERIIIDALKRAKNKEPLEYIFKKAFFFGLEFYVDKNVLIPRPETELLAEEAIKGIRDKGSGISNVIDIGTGSGCIIISLAKNLPAKNFKFLATDVSNKALKLARKNAKLHGVEKKIKFLKGNLLAPSLDTKYKIQDTILIANLPYIDQKMVNGLFSSVKDFEPLIALDGGKEGLEIYQELFRQIKGRGAKNVYLFLEIDPRQSVKIKKMINYFWPKANVNIKKDYAGHNRIVIVDL